jgi:hypothetical protein
VSEVAGWALKGVSVMLALLVVGAVVVVLGWVLSLFMLWLVSV